ncbi:MAG: FAD-dependent oxidoreductase [Christensenellaceae bacterium]|jgi:NADPH-dependent glutamate synthase beta subunit-like oxidoreductase|nr:FAD-dependent oxidoreductase [Christensenellaceae bacterium]
MATRKIIIKLGQHITDRIWHKVNANDPEYKGLDPITTDEMAEVALKMKKRTPYSPEVLAQKTGKPLEKVKEICDQLCLAGVCEFHVNKEGNKEFILPIYVPGSGEIWATNWDNVEKFPQIAQAFSNLAYVPLKPITSLVPIGGGGIAMHVIPVEKAIPAGTKTESFEHLSYWLKKYDKFAAIDCVCRHSQIKINEGTGDMGEEMCIIVGDLAQQCVETGRARRYHTYEEVLEILQRSEDLGYVHQVSNVDGENKIFVVCNCCVTSCYALRSSQLFNAPNMSRSNFIAKVDKEKCVACGRCVDVCPANAAKLGQKLCGKDGEVKYPRRKLPDAAIWWGHRHWTPEYRDRHDNCYDTGTAPCKTNCPAHVSVQGYIKKAAEGKYQEALALIKQDNPFPAVCGRICNRRCEDACTRGAVDGAVAIDDIKDFIARQELNGENAYIPPIVYDTYQPRTQKIAVIGAGPAGMTCAYFLARKGFPVTVFDKNAKPGGMLLTGIPSFRLEKDIIDAEIDVLRKLGVEFKCGVEVGKDITIADLRAEGYKAFYVAVGCQGGRLTGVPGETAEGVQTGIDFLYKVNSDESYQLEGRTVIVGGGNVAIDTARAALRAKSAEVSMFCLEGRSIMPASVDEIEEAEEEGIVINNSWGPKEILVEDGKVKGIVFKKCTRVYDDEKKFAPQYDENDTKTVECENVLFSVGQTIKWGNLLDGTAVQFGRGGAAVADSLTYQTAEADIFVGGDVYSGPKFAIDAIAAGREGAISIGRFVLKGHSLTIGRNRRKFIQINRDNVVVPSSFDNTPARQRPAKPDVLRAKETFRDLRVPLTEEQLKKETSRCLSCGASVVDSHVCIGCGLCTTKCEFDAIHLEKVFDGKMVPAEKMIPSIVKHTIKRAINVVTRQNDHKYN